MTESPPLRRIEIKKPEVRLIDMLTTIAIVLLVIWALGLITSYTLGGLIHILLIIAIIMILVRVIRG